MKHTLHLVAGGALGAGVAIYLAAVGVYAQVEGEANWWPYGWLWIVAAVMVLATVTWLVTVGSRDGPVGSSPSAKSESNDLVPIGIESGTTPTAPVAATSQSEPVVESGPSGALTTDDSGPVLPGARPLSTSQPGSPTDSADRTGDDNVVKWGEMIARRMPNDAWVVTWTNGQRAGSITPIGQGWYSALHVHGIDAGQHRSIEEAMHAIWEAD